MRLGNAQIFPALPLHHHSFASHFPLQRMGKQLELQSELRSIERMLVLTGCASHHDFITPHRHGTEHARLEQPPMHIELGVNTTGVVDDELAKIERFLRAI